MVQDPDDAELLHADYEVGGVLKVLEERGVRVTKLCREAATRTNTLEVPLDAPPRNAWEIGL